MKLLGRDSVGRSTASSVLPLARNEDPSLFLRILRENDFVCVVDRILRSEHGSWFRADFFAQGLSRAEHEVMKKYDILKQIDEIS